MRLASDDLLQNLEWVRALAARLVFDRDQRADLEQEVWHAALRGSPPAGIPLRAWLAGIARNLAAMWRRSTGRRERRERAVASAGTAPNTATLAEHAELQQRLLAAVNALPAELRDVVLLRFLEGEPPRAISRRLGIPVATVRTRLQRAQALLRERLDADFGDRRAWALAFAMLGRPRDVAAAAGAFTTFMHVGLAAMNTNKLLVAGAALVALAAIPAAIAWSGSAAPAEPRDARAEVAAQAPHATPTAQPDPAAATPAREVAVAPARSFRGRVVDVDGTPLAAAIVRKTPLRSFDARVESGELKAGDTSATTGEDGAFTLNEAGVRGEKVAVAAELDGWIAREATSPCSLGTDATIVMLRTHEVPLTVEVRDRRSNAPPRFRVFGTTALRLPGQDVDTRTARQLKAPDGGLGENGVYRGTARFVEGLPFEVLAQCMGHGRDGWGEPGDPVPRVTVMPKPGEPIHLEIPVDLGGAEAVAPIVQRGQVVDERTGQAIPGAEVSWYREARNQNYRYVQSRNDGTFAIALPDDGTRPRLTVRHDDHQMTSIAADPQRELLVRLGPLGSLTCRLVDGDGVPLPGAALLVTSSSHSDFHERRRTDERGEVRLDRLQAGSYVVHVLRRYGDVDEHALASVGYEVHGQDVKATVATAAGDAVHVIGTVVGGPDGLAPLFVPHAGEARWIRCRANGRSYDAGGVPRGDHLVVLMAADDDHHDLPTILLPRVPVQGLGTAAIDLVVPTGVVRGRVVTHRTDLTNLRVLAVPEVPAGGLAAELLANSRLGGAAGAALAADGSFAVQHVADGAFRLEVREVGTVLASRAVRVNGSLDLPDWAIDD